MKSNALTMVRNGLGEVRGLLCEKKSTATNQDLTSGRLVCPDDFIDIMKAPFPLKRKTKGGDFHTRKGCTRKMTVATIENQKRA